MSSEVLMFQQLAQILGGGLVWLQVALLLGLLAAALFRPERIRVPGLFRAACILFALSVFVAPVLTASLVFLRGFGGGVQSLRGSGSSLGEMLLLLVNTARPVLLGISSLLALIALCPAARSAYHSQPPRHPLE